MEFELLFDFTGGAGNGQEVEPTNVTEEMREKLIIRPLKKEGLTTFESNNNFVAEDWQVWEDGRSVGTPSAFISSYVQVKDKEKDRLRLGAMTFGLTRDNDGPRHWQWRSSVDGFETPLPIENFPQEQIDRGVIYDDGIIELPAEAPTDPMFFGPFFINFKALAKTDLRWIDLTYFELRLFGYYTI